MIPILLCAVLGSAISLDAQVPERLPPRPIRSTAAFQRAVGAGTRALDGRPGSIYWQQRASYVIEASLDPETGRVSGHETITYENRSPDTLESVLLHLDQNVFKEGARRNRRAPITGGVTLGSVRVDGRIVDVSHPGRGYYQSLTLLTVPLPRKLAPGASVDIELDWSHQVPAAPTFRNGNLDGEVYAVAQWYPRVAVYDDLYGWDTTPYLGDGEFYLEYGDFDVRLTVPAGWLIGATGTLQNGRDFLPSDVLERLEQAATSDATIRITTGAALAGEGTRTWHFTASDVRDFAWSTSAGYAWDAVRATDGALAQALYRPRLEAWERAAEYAALTVSTLSREIGPYRYPQVTITEGPVGGMEYPMLVLNPSTNNPSSLAGVTIHETAHQWFPMMVGSMEAKHAFMDEGFVSYWEEIVLAEVTGEDPPPWGENRSYLATAGTEQEVPLMRHTDLVSPYGARGLAAYTKPAVTLGALREVVGDDVFVAAFKDYFASWQLKHPQPWDFFSVVERHADKDLDWFWRPLLFETDVFDQAVAGVRTEGSTTRIRIRDEGDVVLPTLVRVTLSDGRAIEHRIDAEQWLTRREIEFTVDGVAATVELDPDGRFPDVDRADNRWGR